MSRKTTVPSTAVSSCRLPVHGVRRQGARSEAPSNLSACGSATVRSGAAARRHITAVPPQSDDADAPKGVSS